MSEEEPKKPMLALPSTAEETVDVVGMNDKYKLNELGPVGKEYKSSHLTFTNFFFLGLVVNENGTLSRINNWHEMNEIERANVNRVLLKRNRQRLAKLQQEANQ